MVRRSSLAAPPAVMVSPPQGGAAVGRPGGRAVGVGGRAGRSWPAARTGGRAADRLSGGGADEWTDGRSRAGGWWADG